MASDCSGRAIEQREGRERKLQVPLLSCLSLGKEKGKEMRRCRWPVGWLVGWLVGIDYERHGNSKQQRSVSTQEATFPIPTT